MTKKETWIDSLNPSAALTPRSAVIAYMIKYGQGIERALETQAISAFLKQARRTKAEKERERDSEAEAILKKLPLLQTFDGRWFMPTKKKDLTACAKMTKEQEDAVVLAYPQIFRDKKKAIPAFLPGLEPPL